MDNPETQETLSTNTERRQTKWKSTTRKAKM